MAGITLLTFCQYIHLEDFGQKELAVLIEQLIKMFQFFGLSVAPKYEYDCVKVDPISGFSEFPDPDDTKATNFLPILIDTEEEQELLKLNSSTVDKSFELESPDNNIDIIKNRNFWMPDHLCKVCYNCEEIFTMYRRKHHCRICGQIFCHACSNYSIDGSLISLPGQVRVCRLCCDQIYELSNANKELLADIGHILPSKLINSPNSKRKLTVTSIADIDRSIGSSSKIPESSPLVKRLISHSTFHQNSNLDNMQERYVLS